MLQACTQVIRDPPASGSLLMTEITSRSCTLNAIELVGCDGVVHVRSTGVLYALAEADQRERSAN